MNYNEALNYIHSITWRGSRLGLDRTRELMELMGHPERGMKYIHIAGTNGKGSTAAMLSEILQKAGYRTGLYTSPFINRFNERIQCDGEPIDDGLLGEITGYVKQFAETMEDPPTEFEMVTAIGFEFFKRMECDIVLLEVGMGGTLDSTNVIDVPEVAVITAIDYDHTAELGTTLAEIAEAKAGIIKPGSSVVIYGQNPEAAQVFDRVCKETNSRIYRPEYEKIELMGIDLYGQRFRYKHKELQIPLVGSYQLKNAAMVLTVVEVLREKGWKISEEAVQTGLLEVRWPGRFEVLGEDPVFIVDGGHNPQGVKATTDSLIQHFPDKKIHFLLGVMADKDVEAILNAIAPIAEGVVTVTPDHPRAMKCDKLAALAAEHGIFAVAGGNVAEGVERVRKEAGNDGVVCAMGSLYMTGDIRSCFQI